MTESQKRPKPVQSTQDFIRIQDIIQLCLAHWHWFVLSLAVCLGIAVFHLLRTPKVYTRSASILIKDDAQGSSAGGDAGFSDLGIFATSTNINNEMGTMRSPDLMREVVLRLNLATTYYVEGRFHDNLLYGSSLPVHVSLPSFTPDEVATFRLRLAPDSTFTASEFTHNGAEVDGEAKGRLGATVQSPIGTLTVVPSAFYKRAEADIRVVRSTVSGTTGGACGSLQIARQDDQSDIITLTYVDRSTQRAEDVLNTFIAVYNENWVKDKNQIAVSTSQFIKERLGVIENELGLVDDDISTFKSQNQMPDVAAAASMYMTEAVEAKRTVRTLDEQVQLARYVRDYLTSDKYRNQLLPANVGFEGTDINAQISAYNTQLMERNSVASKSSDTNPLVVEMDTELASLRRVLVSTIDNAIVALQSKIRNQQTVGAQASQKISSNPEQAKYLLSVERQQKVKESLYLYLLQKREENELSQAFNAYNTRVIIAPSGSMAPTAPVRNNILLVAFAIGLLLPLVVIVLRENANTTVRGRKDIENLTMPFLGEIPEYISHADRRRLFHRHQPVKSLLLVKSGKRDVVNEAFRVLRTNIEFVTRDSAHPGQANVILLTSFNASSGKSFLSVNIAVSFAIRGKRVLVMDCDLRRGTSSDYVGSPAKGLTDYLSGKEDSWQSLIVTDEKLSGVSVLPMGAMPPNPTELLYSDRLAPLFEALRGQYDYIFVDCPPVEIVADAQILEQYADRTCFVVRAGLLERSMVPELQKLYDEQKHRNMCVILNGTQSSGGRYGKYGYYRYGYGYGYGYGYHYGSGKRSSRK